MNIHSSNLNICQVSLKGNISTIKENISQFKIFYPNFKLFIICPKKEKKFFEQSIKYDRCKIINEEEIISKKKFINIANKYFKKNSYYDQIQNRLGWYYQQILKISFIIKFVKQRNEPMLMWDADTIILKKFQFFDYEKTIKYGTTLEYHRAYFHTNKKILNILPKYFLAMTNQFIGLTPLECNFLLKKLLKKQKNLTNLAELISNIVISSVSLSHEKYNGSMFSEQELIGQSNLLYSYTKQKLIHGLRYGLNGRLNKLQKKISIIFGYHYVSYEYSHPNIQSKNMLKRTQNWFTFFLILMNNSSNKFFRGLKHYLK